MTGAASGAAIGVDWRPTPAERARKNAAARCLGGLLAAILAVHVVPGVLGTLRPAPPLPPLPPLEVNLATDPGARLVLLPGIGPRRAEAILEDRRRRGPLPSLEALARVPGLGPATVQRLRRARNVRVVARPPERSPGR